MALEPLPGNFNGPVLCAIAYETEEEAIRIANDSRDDLHAIVSGPIRNVPAAWLLGSASGHVAMNGMCDEPPALLGVGSSTLASAVNRYLRNQGVPRTTRH